jgi:hypothetical protein
LAMGSAYIAIISLMQENFETHSSSVICVYI